MMPRLNKVWGLSCQVCARIREIMVMAPWSIFDLLTSLIIQGMGVYLIGSPGLFLQVGGVYRGMASLGNESVWGVLFLLCGGFGFLVCIWIVRLHFLWRLAARMAVGFCLLSLTLNNLSYPPPPLSTIAYGVLGVASLWGVLRTKTSGR